MNTNEAKPWYQSRTIIGAIVSLLCTAVAVGGVQVLPEMQGEITDVLLAAGVVAGSILSIYGRLKAARPIGSAGKSAVGRGVGPLAITFLLLGGLALGGPVACGTAQLTQADATSPAQRLYAVQADYNAALAAAAAYVESPAAEPDIVQAIARADRYAYAAIRQAQATVRAGDSATVGLAIAAASAAVSGLGLYLAQHAGGGS